MPVSLSLAPGTAEVRLENRRLSDGRHGGRRTRRHSAPGGQPERPQVPEDRRFVGYRRTIPAAGNAIPQPHRLLGIPSPRNFACRKPHRPGMPSPGNIVGYGYSRQEDLYRRIMRLKNPRPIMHFHHLWSCGWGAPRVPWWRETLGAPKDLPAMRQDNPLRRSVGLRWRGIIIRCPCLVPEALRARWTVSRFLSTFFVVAFPLSSLWPGRHPSSSSPLMNIFVIYVIPY
jgi:hypothetical protein